MYNKKTKFWQPKGYLVDDMDNDINNDNVDDDWWDEYGYLVDVIVADDDDDDMDPILKAINLAPTYININGIKKLDDPPMLIFNRLIIYQWNSSFPKIYSLSYW